MFWEKSPYTSDNGKYRMSIEGFFVVAMSVVPFVVCVAIVATYLLFNSEWFKYVLLGAGIVLPPVFWWWLRRDLRVKTVRGKPEGASR